MRPSKKQLQRAAESGAIERIDIDISAAHILIEIARTLMEYADEEARSEELLLGEIKQASTRLEVAARSYTLLWRDLLRESGAAQLRLEDYLHYFPYICRLLSIDPYVVNPATGNLVSEDYEKMQQGSGEQTQAATPQPAPATTTTDPSRLGGGLKAHAIRSILQKAKNGGVYEYNHATLTEEQRASLGEERKLTFQTHKNLDELFTLYAKRANRPKRDLLNEALVEYIANH